MFRIGGNIMRIEGLSTAALPQDIFKTSQTSSQAPAQLAQPAPEKQTYDAMLISQITTQDRSQMPVSEKVVIDAIEKANKAIMGANKKFEFTIHEKTKEIMVKVIDTDTNENIREIPNEKVLDMVAKLCEMAGVLVDERR